MPRYLVERSFDEVWQIPPGGEGRRLLLRLIACNSDRRVTWLHSYVAQDGRKSFCIYDAPSPEAIRLTARANDLPVDRIVEISVLDAHPYVT
jgi:hypothetical protein